MSEPKFRAMIMAGGRGQRMAASHPDVPKPLVTVAGRSLLETMIRRVLDAGASQVVLALRHRADEIRDHVIAVSDLPHDRISFLVEDEPLGTIGSLHGLRGTNQTVLVTNGDLLSAVDLVDLLRDHHERRSDLTIATHDEKHRIRLGEVLTDSHGKILDYHEKPTKVYRISSGIYCLDPRILALIEERGWLGFPTLVKRVIEGRLAVQEYFHEDPWIDVNDEHDLVQARKMAREDPAAFGFDPAAVKS